MDIRSLRARDAPAVAQAQVDAAALTDLPDEVLNALEQALNQSRRTGHE